MGRNLDTNENISYGSSMPGIWFPSSTGIGGIGTAVRILSYISWWKSVILTRT
jgi:hypothetical protein